MESAPHLKPQHTFCLIVEFNGWVTVLDSLHVVCNVRNAVLDVLGAVFISII